MRNGLLQLAALAAAFTAIAASASFYRTDGTVTLPTATDRGFARVEVGDPGYRNALGTCPSVQAFAGRLGDAGFVNHPPPGVTFPFGLFKVDASSCEWNWGRLLEWGGTLPSPPPLTRRVFVQLDEPVAPGMAVWAFGPTFDNPVAHWHELPTGISGREFVFDAVRPRPAEWGTAPPDQYKRVTTVFGLGIRDRIAFPAGFQDLWWAGPAENGWGMSITQHRDQLFVALFIYDRQGNPRWLVIPGGQWNALGNEFTGSVYRPTGTPFAANKNPAFQANAPVGEATIRFESSSAATLTYRIDGVVASKSIQRQLFGPPQERPAASHGDLYWGGDGNPGWGVALAQQHDSFFAVWYTYDAAGETTWFVLPAGEWDATHTVYSGRLYQPRGSPWLGTSYDPALLEPIVAGEATLTFTPEFGTINLRHTLPRAPLELIRQPF